MKQTTRTILVSGATGLVGSALCQALEARGHCVRRLSRSRNTDVHWDLEAGTIDDDAMNGVDVVVHLAGETVAQRWNRSIKATIMDSRVESAKLLVNKILEQPVPPAYISASGINYYGYQCGTGMTEGSPAGDGFLADVCREWEGAAWPLIDAGIRTAFARIGLVLSSRGGALKRMLPAFRMGAGGRISSGQQHMSWIALPDMVKILCQMIEDTTLSGPVNATSPECTTNEIFIKTLGKALKRPTAIPMPKTMVKLLFGEMGGETLCSDIGVVPEVLEKSGFKWDYADLQACLEACIRGEF